MVAPTHLTIRSQELNSANNHASEVIPALQSLTRRKYVHG